MRFHHTQMLLDTSVELAKGARGSFRTNEGMRGVVCVGCGTVLEEFARALEPLQGRSISAFARRVGELFQHFVTCFVVPLDIDEGFI